MFLFRFVEFFKFRKTGITPEWEARYDYLCENTDFLYLRNKEKKAFRLTFIGFLAYCISMWFLAFNPIFASWQMTLTSIIFTVLLVCYSLSVYSYIPMEIEFTEICNKKETTRRPAFIAKRKKRNHRVEFLHKYYIYTTASHKQAVDMTDRILEIDQNYEFGEDVFCFTGINKSVYYLLPKIKEYDNENIEGKETQNV